MDGLAAALALQAGYNTAVVSVGAALLGAGAGAIGVFVLLRGRALVADAASHATLPGVVLGFIAASAILGDGRVMVVLLVGAALTATLGVVAVHWIATSTRLPEDAAIASVLATFFALGVVLLTVVQYMPAGGQAGLEGYLLGATAGMLLGEAVVIAAAAAIVLCLVLALHKEFGLVAFDREFASTRGYAVGALDLSVLVLMLAVVVIGLKTVGLVLVVALAIIPPVAARLWTERLVPMVLLAAAIGAAGSYVGAAISASAPRLPTGAIIVLTLFALFVVSLLVSPTRGLVAVALRLRRFRHVVHARQGLLAVARAEPVLEPLSRRILRRRGYLRRSGEPTPTGRVAAARVAHDQALWNRYREIAPEESLALPDWSLRPIGEVLPPDLVADLERDVVAGRP